ncbi:MAG TPA: RNA polymerase sigma factor [Vicinamibacterales bacterium]
MYLVNKQPDEPALVARVLQGEAAAFEELLRPHEAALFTLACRMLGDREEARDAVQSALLRAYQHLAQFDPAHRFFSWIYRIVMNECLNRRRARVPEDELPPTLAARGTPFEAAAASERAAQIRAALLRLSPEHRAVVTMRHFGGLSYDEIGEALGIPAKTVKSRLYSARQRLGELLLGWSTES